MPLRCLEAVEFILNKNFESYEMIAMGLSNLFISSNHLG